MNRNCSACDIMIDINNYKKDRTVCKTCYNKNKRKNNTSYQQPDFENVNKKVSDFENVNKKVSDFENVNKKVSDFENVNNKVSEFENHRHVIIGPSNVGKTYYMLKILEKIGNKRPVHIITRSPNQYPNYKTSTEIKPISKYKGSVVIFDDM